MIGLIFLTLLVLGALCMLFSFIGMLALVAGAIIPLTFISVIKTFALGFILVLAAFGYMMVTTKRSINP